MAIIETTTLEEISTATSQLDKQTRDLQQVTLKKVSEIRSELDKVEARLQPLKTVRLSEAAQTAINIRRGSVGPPSLIEQVDELVGHFVPELYAIYGATGVGKSWLAVSIASGFLHSGRGLIITTETSYPKWLDRVYAHLSKTPLGDSWDTKALHREANRAAKFRSWISDRMRDGAMLDMARPTPEQIERAAIQVGGIKWIIVDSFTNMAGPGTRGSEKSTGIANGLQALARTLNVPVITTVQVRPDVEDRFDCRPRLGDSFGSGMIEMNAGVVLGLYDHNYYVQRGLAMPDSAYPQGTIEVSLLKHRNREVPSRNSTLVNFIGGCGMYSRPSETEPARDAAKK